jgi:hypothetical protein
MSKREKLLKQLKNNPKGDWKIDTLKAIADHYLIEYADNGSSHLVFRSPYGMHLTVPAHRPIKPIYIRLFVEFVETIAKGDL